MSTKNYKIGDITFVIIGKNEGKILRKVFTSVLKITEKVIFVDSNSSDDSVNIALSCGVPTILQHKQEHVTAPYSRNIGARHVKTKLIHFLDGDEELEESWLLNALTKINDNDRICGVHGYKKVYRKDFESFFILKDPKSWEPDYLQGAFLIENDLFQIVGGFDARLFGEEERDLYVKVKGQGKEIWYIDELMCKHFDFKTKSLFSQLKTSNNGGICIPIFNAVNDGNLKSYIFVYRYLLICLTIEITSMLFLLAFNMHTLFIALLMQIMLLFYCSKINRRGYWIFWKRALIGLVFLRENLNRKVKLKYNVVRA